MAPKKPVGIVCPIPGASSTKFMWAISNFAHHEDSNRFLESPSFTTDSAAASNIQWHLRVYPNKIVDDWGDYDKKEYAICLYANNSPEPATSFEIYTYACQVIVCESLAIENRKNSKLVRQRDYLVKNDKFTIVCELTYNKTNLEGKEQQVDVIPRLQNEYEAIFQNNKFSDVSLISEGKTTKVHKCILTARSSVFAAMFDAEMRETKENTVEITDIKYDVLLEMLRFIYSGKINNIDTLAGELAVAADKYALDDLKNACEKTMIKNVCLDNVIGCAQFAENLRMDNLKERAIEFIVENASNVSGKLEFNLLSHEILRQVIRRLAEKKK